MSQRQVRPVGSNDSVRGTAPKVARLLSSMFVLLCFLPFSTAVTVGHPRRVNDGPYRRANHADPRSNRCRSGKVRLGERLFHDPRSRTTTALPARPAISSTREVMTIRCGQWAPMDAPRLQHVHDFQRSSELQAQLARQFSHPRGAKRGNPARPVADEYELGGIAAQAALRSSISKTVHRDSTARRRNGKAFSMHWPRISGR